MTISKGNASYLMEDLDKLDWLKVQFGEDVNEDLWDIVTNLSLIQAQTIRGYLRKPLKLRVYLIKLGLEPLKI